MLCTILMPDIRSGAQHKAMVEYAPSQRVPKPSTKKDGREGTIYKGITVIVICAVLSMQVFKCYPWAYVRHVHFFCL